jgi:CheY-like chemotaxis protein
MPSVSSRRVSNSANILLVDDNRDGVDARRSVLQELGYTVVSAHCGLEALKTAAEQDFDLIITDFKMEPMNGLELISKLRERKFQNPIILLTGFAESLGLRAENTGANVVMQKSANEVSNLVRHTKRLLQPPRKPVRSQASAAKLTRTRSEGG